MLDTNVWIFGLREHPEFPASSILLRNLPKLFVKIPRQILLELRANLTEEELNYLFKLLNRYPDHFEIRWAKVRTKLINRYLKLGCKLGDAAVAAHIEELKIDILVTENRDFLSEIKELPFQVMNSGEAVKEFIR